MLLGYNHNITYKGSVFHIQTEDSGVKNPHIITLLYREGVILCSKKTSYADILRIDNLEAVVEDLMKEQHKEMLRRLKNGEFDERAFGEVQTAKAGPNENAVAVSQSKIQQTPSTKEAEGIHLLFHEDVVTTTAVATTATTATGNKSEKHQAVSLDDAILNFFGASK